MNFNDIDGKFSESLNNYVQLNYNNRLFIITGSPCRKLFCYDLITNEMEYINTLKYNHNWWPVLIINNEPNLICKINLYCLTGSYTKNCEELVFYTGEKDNKEILMEWKDIPAIITRMVRDLLLSQTKLLFMYYSDMTITLLLYRQWRD